MALEPVGLRAVIDNMGQFRAASNEIDRAYSNLSVGSEKAAGRMSKLGDIAKTAIGFAVGQVAVQGIKNLTSSLAGLVTGAAPLKDMEDSFKRLTASYELNSQKMISSMQAASKGTISDAELIQSANKALIGAGKELGKEFGEALPQLLEMARASAKATGQDVGFLFESLVTGIKRSSPMIIDNTGLQLKVAEATEAYAKSLGKTTKVTIDNTKKIGAGNKKLDDLKKALHLAKVKQSEFNDKTKDSVKLQAKMKIDDLTKQIEEQTGAVDDLSKAHGQLAEATEDATEELTAEQKQIALLRATLAAGKDMVAAMGETQLTTAEKMAIARAQVKNLKDQIGLFFLPTLDRAVQLFLDVSAGIREMGKDAEGLGPKLIAIREGIIEWITPRIPTIIEKLEEILTAAADWAGRVAIPKMVQVSVDIAEALFGLGPKPGWERKQIEGLSKGISVIEHEIDVWERELAPGVRIGMPAIPGMKIGMLAPPEMPEASRILTPEWKREMIAAAGGVGQETVDVIHKEIGEGMAIGMPAPPPTMTEVIVGGFKEIGRNAAEAFVEGLKEGFAGIDWKQVWLTLSPFIMPTMPGGAAERLFQLPGMEEVRAEAERKQAELGPTTHPLRAWWDKLFKPPPDIGADFTGDIIESIGIALDVPATKTPRKESKQLGEDIAGDTLEATKAFLEIRSASRKYEKIGESIAEGMADGIKSWRSIRGVTDALTYLMRTSQYAAMPTIQNSAQMLGRTFVVYAAMAINTEANSIYVANAIIAMWKRAAALAASVYRVPLPPAPPYVPPIPGPPEPPYMQYGGIVPGPRGQPQWIVAHGGEEIIPTWRVNVPALAGGPQYISKQIIHNWSPQLNARYEEVQRPASLMEDLETLAVLYRMG